ncbi:hypothetical protein RF11_11149 [Thelohanellus kitauei]|uniref:Uncharacterized protein n=1 Tax=Thelohanellus kitauei TaxID=669202 RepID=A0A0C2NFK3_THEKT|nr:hypothetical protein RF11_11149 [Thelohanellus kitauei]
MSSTFSRIPSSTNLSSSCSTRCFIAYGTLRFLNILGWASEERHIEALYPFIPNLFFENTSLKVSRVRLSRASLFVNLFELSISWILSVMPNLFIQFSPKSGTSFSAVTTSGKFSLRLPTLTLTMDNPSVLIGLFVYPRIPPIGLSAGIEIFFHRDGPTQETAAPVSTIISMGTLFISTGTLKELLSL